MARKIWLFLIPVLAFLGAARTAAGSAEAAEKRAVEEAVLDYVEALYQVDPSRIERSVHPTLAKVGFYRRRVDSPYEELRMSYDQLHQLAANWNQNRRVDPRTAVKEIVVYEVLDQTASARLLADWGIDYMHLAKYDGRWQIVNVLWQNRLEPRH